MGLTLKELPVLYCKSTIKTLAQVLTTLQSSDGLHEIQRDDETMTALSQIVSLTFTMGGISAEGDEDGADPGQDVIDCILDEAPITGQPLPKTIPPLQPGPSMGFSAKGKPIHSFLLHYPIMSMIGLPLSAEETDLIQQDVEFVISSRAPPGSFPKVRLLKDQVVIVLHDDAEELEEMRSRLGLAQQALWENSNRMDLNFRFVRGWGQPVTLIVFQYVDDSVEVAAPTELVIDEIRGGRKDVVGAIMAAFPILRQHQQLGLYDVPLAGGKMYQDAKVLRQHNRWYGMTSSYSSQGTRMSVIVPINSGDFDFAQDFAALNSPFTYEGVEFDIKVERLQDPTKWPGGNGEAWDMWGTL